MTAEELLVKNKLAHFSENLNRYLLDGYGPAQTLTMVVAAMTEYAAIKAEEATAWQPIETAPRDGTKIQVWHVVWNCTISVYYLATQGSCPWVCATKTNKWPAEAFSHWMHLPNKPILKTNS